MTLKGRKPLVTLEISLDLEEIKRAAGVPLKTIIESSDKIQEKVEDILTLIYPNLTIVDVSKSAACITSFECNPLSSSVISAIFQGYAKDDKSKS
ncbi:hypothetical protein LCGC14_0574150 [marine sediment metagenome]|uniref:Uncharacterized protein n=1 Tax=marine sediment metagenome TaxID=412755 RepID=A0A0F9RII5_9ZZZZ